MIWFCETATNVIKWASQISAMKNCDKTVILLQLPRLYCIIKKKKEKKLEWTTCLTPSHQAFLSLWLMKIFHYSRLRKAVCVCACVCVGVCVRVLTCICVLLCVRTNLLLFLGMCGSIQNQFEYIRLSMFILHFTL